MSTDTPPSLFKYTERFHTAHVPNMGYTAGIYSTVGAFDTSMHHTLSNNNYN